MSEGTYLNERWIADFAAEVPGRVGGGARRRRPDGGPWRGLCRRCGKEAPPVTDIDILNYALTLESLEATFYTQGLKKFGKGDFERYFKNNFDRNRGLGLDGEAVYEKFERISEHEQTHVKTLRPVIRDSGASPCPRATYNFNKTAFTSVGSSSPWRSFWRTRASRPTTGR